MGNRSHFIKLNSYYKFNLDPAVDLSAALVKMKFRSLRWNDDIQKIAENSWMKIAQNRNSWTHVEETYIQEWK